MSWHFSQAMEAEFLEASCWDGEPSAPSKLTTQPDSDSSPAKTTARCNPSPSGTTFPPLTASPGLALWMSSLVASRAKTSASPERGQGLPASDQGFGVNLLGSFARFDPATSSWKTPQLLLLGGSEPFSETWPRWGLMRDGVCWAQSMPAHLTSESGFGLSAKFPTPLVGGTGPSTHGQISGQFRRQMAAAFAKWPTIRASDGERGSQGDLIQAVRGNQNSHFKLWPTPMVHDSKSMGPSEKDRKTPCLAALVKWPTPTVCGNHNRKGASPTSGDGLATAVSKEGCSGGPLNPTWVEWLMGWPIGWTALEALETGRFRQWWHLHGRR